jgi:type I restriction enzyme, S subunit
VKWPTTRLAHISNVPIQNGVGESAQERQPGWPRYVRTTDIAGPEALRPDTVVGLPPEIAADALLVPGDLVLCAVGATVGISHLFLDDDDACFAGYLVRVRPNDGVDPRFLMHWTQSQHYWDQIEAGKVRSTIDNFSAGKYRSMMVPLPSLHVQRRITTFLDAEVARIEELIDTKSRVVELCAELRSALVYAAATGQLTGAGRRRPTKVPWAPEIPSHWQDGKLSLLAELGTGHTPSRTRPDWWEDCTIPWITTGEVAQLRSDRIEYLTTTREAISELGVANSSAVVHPAGTVFLSRTASAGYSGIMGADMATSQDFVTWTCGPLLRPRFLLLCLRAMRRDLLERLAQGSTHKTIYMPDIESIRVPVPPVEEQDAIVDIAWDRMTSLIEAEDVLTRQIELLRERRRSLITAAVTGELEVA